MTTTVKLFRRGTTYPTFDLSCPITVGTTHLIDTVEMIGRPMIGDCIACGKGRAYVIKEVYFTEDGYECYVGTRFSLTPSEMALS